MSFLFLHLSVPCRSVWKPFRFSFHAFYEWTGEQKARERRKGVGLGGAAPPPGSIDLMTAHFRGLYAPHSLTTPTR